jgi:prophage maintenance system killer protein
MTAYVFLGLNGYEIEATEPEVVTVMEGVAEGGMSEASLAAWVRKRLRPISDSEE